MSWGSPPPAGFNPYRRPDTGSSLTPAEAAERAVRQMDAFFGYNPG